MKQTMPGLLLRLTMGFVFLWSGMGKVFLGAVPFYMPDLLERLHVTWDAPRVTLTLGILELVIGLLLVLGLFTRFTSVLALLSLLTITVIVGVWVDFGIVWKDIGLIGALIALLCIGAGRMSIDSVLTSDE